MKIIRQVILLVILIGFGIFLAVSFNKPSITTGSFLMNQKTVYCVIDKQGITDKDICCNAIKNAECSKIDGTALINFKNGIYKAEYVCFNEKIYFDSFINEYCKYTL